MTAKPMQHPLLRCLRDPAQLAGLDKAGWVALFRQARGAALLPRLADLALARGLCEAIPVRALAKLRAARTVAERNAADVRYESHCVVRTLADLAMPLIVLKGAAYLLAGLPLARRRLCADLDILVPKARLADVEAALLGAGWQRAEVSDYDAAYYRRWMHELPPLAHPDHALSVDVHHTIHPPTARQQLNTAALFEAAVPLPGSRPLTLCPADMVLHAGLHLFNEEIILGLAGIADLHDLLSEFGRQERFWEELAARARLHGLQRVLYYTLRYTHILLQTPIPDPVLQASAEAAPSWPLRAAMDRLFLTALVPPAFERRQPARAVALWLLYVRSHWLRMPLRLLLPHLGRKAVQRHLKLGAPLRSTSTAR